MNVEKFCSMLKEFGFLLNCLALFKISSQDDLCSIQVRRGDKNLLEVCPGETSYDFDIQQSSESRRFLAISHPWYLGKVTELSHYRVHANEHGVRHDDREEFKIPIGEQLLKLDHKIDFLVELSVTGDDCTDGPDYKEFKSICIYKMEGFDWKANLRQIPVLTER